MVLFDDFLSFSTLFEAFFIFISKYTLIAIPFFIYAGFLMEKTGLVKGLFNFADAAGNGFASNGYGDQSPGGFGLGAVLITEIVLTAIFLIVILGATERRGAGGQAGLAIGLTLALIHLISIPVSNTSVNPA